MSSWIKSWWNYKCPRCRQGDIFIKPMSFSDPVNMPKHCNLCNQRMEPEPGFYYGAMFISYIFSAWYLLLPTLLLVFYFKWSANSAMAFTIFLGLISYTRVMRASRSLWIHINVKHDPQAEQDAIAQLVAEPNSSDTWTPKSSK